MTVRSVAYVLKKFPHLSQTFILNEILALEAKGLKIRIISLKRSDSKVLHQEIKSVRAQVYYLPESFWGGLPRMLRAQAHFLLRHPRRWARVFSFLIQLHRTVKEWLQAGIVAQLLEGTETSHIHAHFATAPTSVAMMTGILLDLPFSFTAHAIDIYHKDHLHHDMLKLKMNRARFVITVSEFNRRYLVGLNPTSSRKVRVVRNGLPLVHFPLRSLDEDGMRILAVGRLVEKKGFPILVEACALLAAKGIQFECDIVGAGPERAQLEEVIRRHGLERHVRLMGAVEDETLRDLYCCATIFALPCRVASNGDRDGLPTVLIEAMALGVPVITTTVTGIPELVADNLTGLLVPPDDPIALAAAVERALYDAELRRRLVRAAREKVERDYQIEVNVAALAGLFVDACQETSVRCKSEAGSRILYDALIRNPICTAQKNSSEKKEEER